MYSYYTVFAVIINYENENPKIIKDASNVLPFDFAKMEVIETLAADKIDPCNAG